MAIHRNHNLVNRLATWLAEFLLEKSATPGDLAFIDHIFTHVYVVRLNTTLSRVECEIAIGYCDTVIFYILALMDPIFMDSGGFLHSGSKNYC